LLSEEDIALRARIRNSGSEAAALWDAAMPAALTLPRTFDTAESRPQRLPDRLACRSALLARCSVAGTAGLLTTKTSSPRLLQISSGRCDCDQYPEAGFVLPGGCIGL
jgi:hypothetical protein